MTLQEFFDKHSVAIGTLAEDLDKIDDLDKSSIDEQTSYLNLLAGFSVFVTTLRRMSEARERSLTEVLRRMGINDN